MSETTAQVTLDGYTDPSLSQLASQAYVQEQIAGAAGVQTQLPGGTAGQVYTASGVAGAPNTSDPAMLTVLVSGATTSRTLAAIEATWINILDYRTGVTDDVALALAFAALPATGGTILMPASGAPYALAAAVSLSGKPVVLQGDGEAGTVVNVNHLGVALTITQAAGANFTEIRGLKFVLNVTGTSAGCMFIDYTGAGESPYPAVKFRDVMVVCGSTGTPVWGYGISVSGGASPPANLGVVQGMRVSVECATTNLPAPTGSYALVLNGVNDLDFKDFVTTNCDAAVYVNSYCEGLRFQSFSCVSNNYFMKQNASMTLGPATVGGTLTVQKMWIHDGEVATYSGGFLVKSISETFLSDLDFVGLGGSNWTALGLTDCFGWQGSNIYIDGLIATGVPQGVHLTASGTTGQYCGDNSFPNLSTNRLSYSVNIGSGCYYNFFDNAFCRSGVPGSSNPVNNVADGSGNLTNRITFANSNGNLSSTRGYLQFDALDYSPGVKFNFGVGAVNYPTTSNAGTGNAPTIGVAGSDSSISLALASKGSGIIAFQNSGGLIGSVSGPLLPANYIAQTATATGLTPTISAVGIDSNISLQLSSKGAGEIVFTNGTYVTMALLTTATPANYPSFNAVGTGNAVNIGVAGSDANINMTISTKGVGSIYLEAPVIPQTTGGIVGTTAGDNANAGSVGEVLTVTVGSGSAVALTSGTPAAVASLVLSAGDWDVWGTAALKPAGTTTTSLINAGINTASAVIPTIGNGTLVELPTPTTAGVATITPLGITRIVSNAATTVYLNIAANFAVSTCGGYGAIFARRVR